MDEKPQFDAVPVKWEDVKDMVSEWMQGIESASHFSLDHVEQKKLFAWRIEHDKICPYYDDGTKAVSPQGAIGGRLSYKFTPTGLGTVTIVSCACGGEINLTDYASW